MGLWKGKKGTSVFYRIKNSNNEQKQGIRERVYDPSNPQTSGQAGQRMKMLPAQRMASVLKSIIERGFEGVKYGAMSRNTFLKYALKQNTGFPATSKDDSKVWPGEYLIAKGTLPEITCYYNSGDDTAHFALECQELQPSTVGDLATNLLANNSFLQAGDQITLCLCESDDNGTLLEAIPVWRTVSFFLNSDDQTALSEIGLTIDLNDSDFGVAAELEYFIAAGLIISRESSTGGHLRSDCRIKVTDAYAEVFFSNEALVIARRSYMKQTITNSDWPTEQPDIIGNTVDGLYTLSGLTGDKASANGTQVKVRVDDETGVLRAVYVNTLNPQGSGYMALVNQNGEGVTYTESGTMVVGYIKTSDVAAFASLPVLAIGS